MSTIASKARDIGRLEAIAELLNEIEAVDPTTKLMVAFTHQSIVRTMRRMEAQVGEAVNQENLRSAIRTFQAIGGVL